MEKPSEQNGENDMDEIKVSEMTEATETKNEDFVMIIQNGTNKKINKENLFKNYLAFTVLEEWEES